MQVNGLFYRLVALQSQKEHQKHLKRRLCRSQGLSGNFGLRKNLFHLPRIETQFPYSLAHSLVTVLTYPIPSDHTVFCENNFFLT